MYHAARLKSCSDMNGSGLHVHRYRYRNDRRHSSTAARQLKEELMMQALPTSARRVLNLRSHPGW
jgi:hypothetical protein